MNIDSQLDALKLKDIEGLFYEKVFENEKVIPKVTPFSGINTDLLYLKDNKLLFVKFMDTSEDLFSILEEEILEVMYEEYLLLKKKMEKTNIKYDYVFVMPNIEIEESYDFDDFIKNNIIDKNRVLDIIDNREIFDSYLLDENNEINLNLFLLSICPEYFVLNSTLHINKDFKKISFYNDEYEYSAVMLDKEQLKIVNSINYEETVFEGGYATGKTSLMFSKCVKLSKIYPHHKFLILTNNKQKALELREKIEILSPQSENIQIHTLNSFVIKLCKKFELVIDYNLLNKDYDKGLNNLIKQINNTIKNKRVFKGIFIDNIENFEEFEVEFIEQFLYQSKFILNKFYSRCNNILNDFDIFKEESISENKVFLNNNYRNSVEINKFINNLNKNSNNYLNDLRKDKKDFFYLTKGIKNQIGEINLIKVDILEEQLEAIIWEINHLVNDKGLDLSEICIVYPYNKKTLKNNKTIYVQYILKNLLEKNNIPYIIIEDSLTNLSQKNGVTLSNMYSLGDLEYKALIVCELEMLYNHSILDTSQDYQLNDFFGDINKLYLTFSKASEYLSIVTTFDDKNSEIINLIRKSI